MFAIAPICFAFPDSRMRKMRRCRQLLEMESDLEGVFHAKYCLTNQGRFFADPTCFAYVNFFVTENISFKIVNIGFYLASLSLW